MNIRPIFLTLALCAPTIAFAEDVTMENLVRAESDTMIRANLEAFEIGIGELLHLREPVTASTQTVIRPNQDTLYSAVVLDLSEPATIMLPSLG